VEVLRGPQGTLYGGSSQGGTIRFITPQPSLTRYSAYTRGEVSSVKGGDLSYEGGLAVGGPIVQDKLGFHASTFYRKTGGYTDYVDPLTPGFPTRIENGDDGDTTALQAAITWAATERGRVTLNYYSSYVHTGDQSAGSHVLESNTPIVVNQSCYRVAPAPTVTGNPAPVACNSAGVTYVRRGATLGPFNNLGPNDTFERITQPSNTYTFLPSLVVDYDFDKMTFKSATSFIHDQTKGLTLLNAQWTRITIDGTYGNLPLRPGLPLNWIDPAISNAAGIVRSKNQRYGMTQEFRFSSAANATPFNWVGGIFFSNIRGTSYYDSFEDPTRVAMAAYGINTFQRFGVGQTTSPAPGGSTSNRYQTLKDTEIAAFGEGNYFITDKLKVTAGLRWSRVSFSYHQELWGSINGSLDPRTVTCGITDGSVSESPITPKLGLQYQATENDMFYVSASKGYRPGGVNTPLSETICGPRVAQLGLTIPGLPTTYNSDTVWSYEGGAKVAVFGNRLRVNSSVFRIDWTNVQLPVTLGGGCGQVFSINAGTARSEGFDLEAQARIFRGLTANLAVGYTNARYVETATIGTGPTAPVVAVGGQKFVMPPWSATISFRYDFQVADKNAYVRVEDRYQAKYTRNYLGTTAYSPDTTKGAPRNIVNARVGVEFRGFDVNLFVNNVGNYKSGNRSGGRSGCSGTTGDFCTSYTNFNPIYSMESPRPREIGLQAAYRY
jgi:outer membrane receptor protein involved in Fe transport